MNDYKCETGPSKAISSRLPYLGLWIALILILTQVSSCSSPGQTPYSLPTSISGNNYYVANSGNDANPGTQVSPWATIQKAANTMMAGDTVTISTGNYSNQRVNITKSGSSSGNITYQASGTVVMKGFNIQASYIDINGFEITNTDYKRWSHGTSAGIYIAGSNEMIENNYIHDVSLDGIYIYASPSTPTISSNNVIRNNKLYHNEMAGIEVSGRNTLIEGNEVWDTVQCLPSLTKVEDIASDNNGTKCPYYTAVSGLDADGMRFFGQGHVFRGNYIHDISASNPLNFTPHIDCFQTWVDSSSEVASNIIFEQNYCENLNLGMYSMTLGGGANHLYIQNNIFVAFGGINISADGTDYLYVYNNDWINKLAFAPMGHPGAIKLLGGHAVIQNNIFYDESEYSIQIIGDTTNVEVGYNLAYNSDGSTPNCVKWGNYNTCQPAPNHELWKVDPQFVNPESGDYHLTSTSPAIDAGYNLGTSVPNDYDGISRPQGAGYDIGAFEFQSPVLPTATQNNTPTFTPTHIITATLTRTPTYTPTRTNVSSLTRTLTYTNTPINTPTGTTSSTPTRTPTAMATNTQTATQISTFTASATPLPTTTPTAIFTPTKTPTLTTTTTPLSINTPTVLYTPTLISTFSATPTLTELFQVNTTRTFNPVADAYVIQSSSDTNYGSNISLQADNSPVERSYLRFVVNGLNGSAIKSAKLRLYANNLSTTGFSVRTLENNTWTEDDINFTNSPSAGSVINNSKPFKSGKWVEVDVSSYVTVEGTFNLVITTKGNSVVDLSSREAGVLSPQLVITITSSPALGAKWTSRNSVMNFDITKQP